MPVDNRRRALLRLCAASGLLLTFMLILENLNTPDRLILKPLTPGSDPGMNGTDPDMRRDSSSSWRHQRDQLSSKMMQLSKDFHQYQCRMEPEAISSSGGWCETNTAYKDHRTDITLIKGLIRLFRKQSVASFGEGVGGYKQEIDKTRTVTRYDAYDGSPFCEHLTNGSVKYLDLTVPIFGFRIYDWVISLEVAEHIHRQHEQTYLDNIAHHAKYGIVLSWAKPGQAGHGHVNGRDVSYVVEELDKRGFEHSFLSSQLLKKRCTYWWLEENINVYRRRTTHPVDPTLA